MCPGSFGRSIIPAEADDGAKANLSSSEPPGSDLRGFVIVFLTEPVFPGDGPVLTRPAARGDGDLVGEMPPLGPVPPATAEMVAVLADACSALARGDRGMVWDCFLLAGDLSE